MLRLKFSLLATEKCISVLKWRIIETRWREKTSLVQGIMAGFFFGTSAIFIRFIPGLDAFTIGFYRLLLASCLLLIIMPVLKQRLTYFSRGVSFWKLSIIGLLLGLHFAAFISSVKVTTVINATVLVNTTPAITLIIYWAWSKEMPPITKLLGLLLCMSGIFLISMAEISFSSPSMIGDLMALTAAALWAAYLVIGKPIIEKIDIISAMTPIYFVGCLVLLMLSLTTGGFKFPTLNQWAPLVGLAIFPTAIGHTLHFSSMKALRPYQTSVLALLEPVVATMLAYFIFNEVPAPPFVVGAVVVLLGIFLIARQ
jgi:drug/metabolite transporter (DMT)-like permease